MFEFAWPWMFLLLPLPWIIRRSMTPAQVKESAALRIPFFNTLESITSEPQRRSGKLTQRKYLAYVIWILLIIAAAGPQWLGKPVELPRSGRDIMLALDLSNSMNRPDMGVNGQQADRLTVVKTAAREFVRHRTGDRIGLILFGTRAYLQTPLTFDRNTIEAMLDDASIGLAGGRTAIGDAVGLALKRLHKVPKSSRVLILLTDGANNAGILKPLQAAEMAKKYNIKIYTIGIGNDRMVVAGLLGPQVLNPSMDLDEGTLQKMAAMTGGEYFRAKNLHALDEVYKKIDALEPVIKDKKVFRPVIPLFFWPLGLAFLLTMLFLVRNTGVYYKLTGMRLLVGTQQ